jgi:hypothetical protein
VNVCVSRRFEGRGITFHLAGGGVDWKVSKFIAIRLAQVDYEWQRNPTMANSLARNSNECVPFLNTPDSKRLYRRKNQKCYPKV